MSQDQIFQQIKSAINSNELTIARELIFNSSEEQPDTITISESLKLSVDQNQWELVQDICQINGDNNPNENAVSYTLRKLVESAVNDSKDDKYYAVLKVIFENTQSKPGEADVDYALEYAYTYGDRRWDFVKYLCALKDIKPTQDYISGALERAARYKEWDVIVQILGMFGDNKPDQDAILYANKRLEILSTKATIYKKVDGQDWDVVKEICLIEGDNKPDQGDISYVLQKLVCYAADMPKESRYLDLLKFIYEKASTKPDEKTTNDTMVYVLGTKPVRWDFVTYLCARNDNKLSQANVNNAIKKGVDGQEWDVIKQILQMVGGNKPDQNTILYTLQTLVRYARAEVGGGNYLDSFKFICEKTPNKPDVNTINLILRAAYAPPGEIRWDFVKYLCALEGNKPAQTSIDEALRYAARCGNLEVVEFICGLSDDRRPQKDAVGQAFFSAARAGKINILRYFGETHSIKLDPEHIVDAFFVSASVDTVNYFLDPKSGFHFSNENIDFALSQFVTNNADISNKIQTIQYLLDRNLPTEEGIRLALGVAEKKNMLSIIDILKKHLENIELRKQIFNKSAQDIDDYLKNKLDSNLGLKEKKHAYITELGKVTGYLQPEKKKQLALYILNNPDHFLKTERHFFRTNNYSNETFSIHQLVKTLMQGEQKDGKITIHDEGNHLEHVISRHVK